MQRAGFAEAVVRRFPWARSMSHQGFIEMAQSSSKVQAAIKASNGVFLNELDQVLQEYRTEDDQIVIEYSTQLFSGHKEEC